MARRSFIGKENAFILSTQTQCFGTHPAPPSSAHASRCPPASRIACIHTVAALAQLIRTTTAGTSFRCYRSLHPSTAAVGHRPPTVFNSTPRHASSYRRYPTSKHRCILPAACSAQLMHPIRLLTSQPPHSIVLHHDHAYLAFVELCHPQYHFQRCLTVAGRAAWFIRRFALRSIDFQLNLLCRPRTPFDSQRVYTLRITV